MAEWRDILERAADNLSVNLDQGAQAQFRQQPAGWPAQRRDVPFVASRDLLARELDAISAPVAAQQRLQKGQAQPRARVAQAPAGGPRVSITQSIGQPAQRPQPDQARPQQAQALAQPSPIAQQPAAKKSNSGRELVALSLSVGIVTLAVYGFLVLLH